MDVSKKTKKTLAEYIEKNGLPNQIGCTAWMTQSSHYEIDDEIIARASDTSKGWVYVNRDPTQDYEAGYKNFETLWSIINSMLFDQCSEMSLVIETKKGNIEVPLQNDDSEGQSSEFTAENDDFYENVRTYLKSEGMDEVDETDDSDLDIQEYLDNCGADQVWGDTEVNTSYGHARIIYEDGRTIDIEKDVDDDIIITYINNEKVDPPKKTKKKIESKAEPTETKFEFDWSGKGRVK